MHHNISVLETNYRLLQLLNHSGYKTKLKNVVGSPKYKTIC